MNKKIKILLLFFLAALIFPLTGEAQTISGIVNNVARSFRLAVGGFVVIAWVVVAVMFLVSWGNPERLTSARKAFIWSVVGTIIYVIGLGIVNIIENALRGA